MTERYIDPADLSLLHGYVLRDGDRVTISGLPGTFIIGNQKLHRERIPIDMGFRRQHNRHSEPDISLLTLFPTLRQRKRPAGR